MLLIVLPSSGQSHPLEAQIIAPGRGEALDCKPSRAETSLVLCKNDLHISKEAETWQGQVPAQAECAPQPCLCFGLRKGKIPPLGLRGLGKSRVPVQYRVLATQKPPPNLGSWQAFQENMLPSSSLLSSPTVSHKALQQLRCGAETLNTSIKMG